MGAKGQSIVGVKEGVEKGNEGRFKGTLTIRAKDDEVASARTQAQ